MTWSTALEETLVERWQVGNKLSTRFVPSLIVQLQITTWSLSIGFLPFVVQFKRQIILIFVLFSLGSSLWLVSSNDNLDFQCLHAFYWSLQLNPHMESCLTKLPFILMKNRFNLTVKILHLHTRLERQQLGTTKSWQTYLSTRNKQRSGQHCDVGA